MLLIGQALKIDQRTGAMGTPNQFTYLEVSVWDGETMYQARMGREWPADKALRPGDTVAAVVSVGAFSRKQGGAGVNVTLLRPVEEADLAPAVELVAA